MSIRHKVNTIVFKLESEGFDTLQALMLKNNLSKNKFFSYTIHSPNYEGDTYKAYYYDDALK